MVNRKLKKKTLKKKSKNKTKKKYMNRRDIENLFMVSSFQKGGVDLHGGGLNERLKRLKGQIDPGPTSVTSSPPLMIHLDSPEQPRTQESSSSSISLDQSSESEQPRTQESFLSSISLDQSIESEQPVQQSAPILHEVTDTDDVTGEHIIFDPENDKCKTLLQELTEMLENIINEFNSL